MLRGSALLSSELYLHIDEPSFKPSLDSKVDEPVGHLGRNSAEVDSEQSVKINLAPVPFENEGAEDLRTVAMSCSNPVGWRQSYPTVREAVVCRAQLRSWLQTLCCTH